MTFRLQRLEVSDREEPFAAIICTADPAKADKRTRSKWCGSCATQRRTSRIPSRWTSSSDGRVASTPAPPGFPGAWGEVLPVDPPVEEWAGLAAGEVIWARVAGAGAAAAALHGRYCPNSRYDAALRQVK